MMGTNRRVVLGVTGSIAAYKAAELVRLLRKSGIDVHVILTRAGAEFITPLTLGTLSEQPVTLGLFEDSTGGPYVHWGAGGAGAAGIASTDGSPEGDGTSRSTSSGIPHIQASRASDLIVVAPATANILGKVAHGIADDALSTAIMASTAPVLFAPAMNTRMWESAAVRENVRILRGRGFHFVQPGSGELACGEYGAGRMADPELIVGEILRLVNDTSGSLGLLVTAGRTEEPIDPVRYLSNRSSGRMAYAVAEAGRDLGFRVTVVAGPTQIAPPFGVEVVSVRTAEEMAREVERRHTAHEVLVMAAAVADYRAARLQDDKIPSGQTDLSLRMIPTRDILASVARKRRRAGVVTIGFALETRDERARARRKLAAKGCDVLVVNNPLRPGSEFGGETNEVIFLFADGTEEKLPVMTKRDVGEMLLRRAREILSPGTNPAGETTKTDEAGRPMGPGRGVTRSATRRKAKASRRPGVARTARSKGTTARTTGGGKGSPKGRSNAPPRKDRRRIRVRRKGSGR